MFEETLQAHSPLLAIPLLLLPLALLLLLLRGSGPLKKNRLPPSPPRLPIIGNLHQLGTLPHRSLHELAQKHGPIMLLKLGRAPTLVVSSAGVAREIMKTHDLIFANRPSLKVARELLSNGMAFAPYGEYWRHLRKICMVHLLSSKMVQSFQLVREQVAASMVEHISRACASSALVNVRDTLKTYVADMLGKVVLGEAIRKDGRLKVFRELIGENSVILGEFNVEDYFPWLAWTDVFTGKGAKAKMLSKKWNDLLDGIIKDHAERSMNGGGDGDDFVGVLLSLRKDGNKDVALTHSIIRVLLVELLAAGTDTTYATLEWGMSELIRHPELMKKLQTEVRAIAHGKAIVREEDLKEMSYLKSVIKETLRVHPAGPLLLPRVSSERCEIQAYEIPGHTRVLVNFWAISRDPEAWESPEEFQPERFMNSSADFSGQCFQFIPFGAGRRICPGMQFAVPSMELALANLVHRFDWELPDNVTRENLDMMEAPGATICRKENLCLRAKPCFH